MRFSELDVEKRMETLHKIANIGAESAGYCGDCIQVCMPSTRPVSESIRIIECFGLKEHGGHYFPLGSDNPPASLRHFGPGTQAAPRGKPLSYWLYWNFAPLF